MINTQYFEINKSGEISKQDDKTDRIRNKPKISIFRSINIGMYVGSPIIGGTLIGVLFDLNFNTKPVGALIGIIIGSISTFYNLFKIIKTNAEY